MNCDCIVRVADDCFCSAIVQLQYVHTLLHAVYTTTTTVMLMLSSRTRCGSCAPSPQSRPMRVAGDDNQGSLGLVLHYTVVCSACGVK